MASTPAKLASNERGRKRRRREIRERVHAYLREHGCKDCGETDVVVLEFDHRDQMTKELNVTRLITSAYSWERVQAEIEKCDVRCANCHRRRTHKQLGWHARR